HPAGYQMTIWSLDDFSDSDVRLTCVGLRDTKVVGGSADGTVFVWDYGAPASA
ncbi:hypothetical protein BGX21_000444, partial [Mortierella sp. AD011]